MAAARTYRVLGIQGKNTRAPGQQCRGQSVIYRDYLGFLRAHHPACLTNHAASHHTLKAATANTAPHIQVNLLGALHVNYQYAGLLTPLHCCS